jgi:hypothetical protein
MAITHGYCTLAELRERLLNASRYTATTISFTAATKKITDTAYGLKRFQTDDVLLISGSTSNDGYYTVAAGNSARELTVSESLVDEAAGASVTIQAVTDVGDDAVLEAVIEGVSRYIDLYCGRHFWKDTGATTRYYTAEEPDWLWVDDLVSVSSLATDSDGDRNYEDTWAEEDYDLWPYNAAAEGMPYMAISATPTGDSSFPVGVAKGVAVTGIFGWPSVPAPVKEACLLMAARLAKRKDAPFGVVGSADMGTIQVIPKLDPDVAVLLAPYRRLRVGAV